MAGFAYSSANLQHERILKWARGEDGEEYSPAPNQVYFRGLFSPTPQVEICGPYNETDYLEAELLESCDEDKRVFRVCPKALDGCLVRLSPKWENKQFDGKYATFSRLKLLVGERRKHYRLRISWYTQACGEFQLLTTLDTTQCFTIGAHHAKRSRSSQQQKGNISPESSLQSLGSNSDNEDATIGVSCKDNTDIPVTAKPVPVPAPEVTHWRMSQPTKRLRSDLIEAAAAAVVPAPPPIAVAIAQQTPPPQKIQLRMTPLPEYEKMRANTNATGSLLDDSLLEEFLSSESILPDCTSTSFSFSPVSMYHCGLQQQAPQPLMDEAVLHEGFGL